DMLIRNLEFGKSARKRVRVELGISPRHRHLPDVHHTLHLWLLQQFDEFFKAPIGVSDREKRQCHGRLHTWFRALPLWAATWSVLSLSISYRGSSFEA